mmetsp:Transcript_61783/g.110009  ORF Transcript_61783/g.110009 Transcript_61783/m.110009 type:complete len:220 (+) Transcript_61783:1338-1997(+)
MLSFARYFAARAWTSSFHVAVNMRVCLSSRSCRTISLTQGPKPMSSILSASSRTRYVTRRRLVVRVPRKSWSRPGEAITTSTPELSSRCCGPRGVPPNIQAERSRLLYLSNSSWICCASSRVGVKNSAIGPSPRFSGGCASTCIMHGRRNVIVLPEPVSATPTTSRPDRAAGQPWHWMGEGCVKASRLKICNMYSGSEDSLNFRMGFGRFTPSTVISFD